jgi:hypothetical protein
MPYTTTSRQRGQRASRGITPRSVSFISARVRGPAGRGGVGRGWLAGVGWSKGGHGAEVERKQG